LAARRWGSSEVDLIGKAMAAEPPGNSRSPAGSSTSPANSTTALAFRAPRGFVRWPETGTSPPLALWAWRTPRIPDTDRAFTVPHALAGVVGNENHAANEEPHAHQRHAEGDKCLRLGRQRLLSHRITTRIILAVWLDPPGSGLLKSLRERAGQAGAGQGGGT